MPNQYTRILRKAFIPIGPFIAYVPLTQGQFALIDSWNIDKIGPNNWAAYWNPACRTFYGTRKNFISGRHVAEYLHNRILPQIHGLQADHKVPGTGLDCREANLRYATPAQQNANKRISTQNTSGYKGASFHKGEQKWRATIKINKVAKHLGYFPTAQLAHERWKLEAIAVFGGFMRVTL